MREIHVDLGSRGYPVHVGHDARSILPQVLVTVRSGAAAGGGESERDRTTVLLADGNTDELYGDSVAELLEADSRLVRVVIPPGESAKTLDQTHSALEAMGEAGVRRNDVLISLGGGMITDLGGFVASIYHRGIASINMPTTLLGQVDAAVGGKTGVNLGAGKNLAGTFWQPRAVIADTGMLETLSDEEFVSGLAEVVKYGLCFDPDLLVLVEERSSELRQDQRLLEDVVSRSVSHKVRLITTDERDEGERMLLNYGHTLGHALEAIGGYRKWSHGQAISVGMVFAAVLSHEMGVLAEDAVGRHESVLTSVGLPIRAEFDKDELRRFLSADKKNLGRMRWILLKDIGEPVVESEVDDRVLDRALERIRS